MLLGERFPCHPSLYPSTLFPNSVIPRRECSSPYKKETRMGMADSRTQVNKSARARTVHVCTPSPRWKGLSCREAGKHRGIRDQSDRPGYGCRVKKRGEYEREYGGPRPGNIHIPVTVTRCQRGPRVLARSLAHGVVTLRPQWKKKKRERLDNATGGCDLNALVAHWRMRGVMGVAPSALVAATGTQREGEGDALWFYM